MNSPGREPARLYSTPVSYTHLQSLPQRDEVQALAEETNVEITSWAQQGAAVLGKDGTYSIETDTGFGTTYTTAYAKLLHGATFFSESAYNALTGQDVDIPAGACANILDDEGGSGYLSGGDATHLTNMATGAELDVTPIEPLRYTMLLGCYVLDDIDYAVLTEGLTDVWREEYVFFNVTDVENSYPLAKALFDEIVDRSGPEVEVGDYYDDVAAALAAQAGEVYDLSLIHIYPVWLHFGAGNLFRAFPAVLAQRLLTARLSRAGVICCEGYRCV